MRSISIAWLLARPDAGGPRRPACPPLPPGLALLAALLWLVPAAPRAATASEVAAPADSAVVPGIAAIVIEGNERTRDYIIERELQVRVGQSARGIDYQLMKTRLHNIDLFSQIDVVADSLSEPGRVRLRVKVKERPSILPYPIAANTSKNGLILGAGLVLFNFRGRNEQLNLVGKGGGVRGMSFSYGNPWVTGNHVSIGLSCGYWFERNRFDDFDEETFWLASGIGTYLGEGDRWRASLNGSFESVISDEEDKTISPDNHDRLHTLGIGLAYDSRDLYKNPSRGWRLGTGASRVGGVLGGTVTYAHFIADLRRYQPLPIGRILGLQARIIRREGEVPDYRQVRMGGSSSVRGYDNGEIEGRHGALISIEHRFDLLGPYIVSFGPLENIDLALSGALFVDAGAAWNDDPELGLRTVAASSGGGLRLFMPWFEVLRADLAFTRDGEVRIELGEGMKF